MQLQITDGYITGYATLGGFDGGVEVPDGVLDECDPDALARGCYLWADGAAVLDAEKLDGQLAAEHTAEIRARREAECFVLINRGALWYERLTDEQRTELDEWYQAWLDAPETGIAPEPLDWI